MSCWISSVSKMPGGGGKYSIYPWMGRCGAAPHTLALFKTNIADFPTHFKTEFQFLIPCLRHWTQFKTKIDKSIPWLRQKMINSIPCSRQKSRKTYPSWPHVPIKPLPPPPPPHPGQDVGSHRPYLKILVQWINYSRKCSLPNNHFPQKVHNETDYEKKKIEGSRQLVDICVFSENNYNCDFVTRNIYRTEPNATNTNLTPTTTVIIPYIKGTSEIIARILQSYNSRVAHRPITTLRKLLTNVKDKDQPKDRQGAVYKIKFCDCQAT